VRWPASPAAGGAALVAVALVARLSTVAAVRVPTGDELAHVPAAHAAAEGRGGAETWLNPPFSYEVLAVSIRALGDGPWGWRLRNVVLGALTPLVLALLAFAAFPGRRRAGWIAGWLLALDPLHVTISRGTFEEVQAIFFFLVAALGVVLAAEGRRTLLLAGVALGCAEASKHYFPVASLVLVAYALAARRDDAPLPHAVHVLVSLVVVPATVYLGTYLPWFLRGHGLGEVAALHLDALAAQRRLTPALFVNGELLLRSGTAGEWFTALRMFGSIVEPGAGWSRYHLLGRNLPAWLLVLPAAAAVAVRGVRERDRGDLLVAGLFAAVYLPLLGVSRPIFVHSAAAVIPLALLVLGRAADLAWDRRPRLVAALLACAVAFALYLYPLATNRRVPDALYAPFIGALTVH